MAGKFRYDSGHFFSVVSNVSFARLHAGISTIEPVNTKAIPFSAFVDAVEEYAVDDETDSEGDMRIA